MALLPPEKYDTKHNDRDGHYRYSCITGGAQVMEGIADRIENIRKQVGHRVSETFPHEGAKFPYGFKSDSLVEPDSIVIGRRHRERGAAASRLMKSRQRLPQQFIAQPRASFQPGHADLRNVARVPRHQAA